MKQSEFLRELKENLEAQMKPEEIKDILTDYEGFFSSGREDGKTDDEISKELGSPAFLAKSLIEEHTKDVGQADKRIANPGKRLCALLIDAVIAVIPAFIISLIVGSMALPYLLILAYPSPVAGMSIYVSYSVYTTADDGTQTSRNANITLSKQNEDGTWELVSGEESGGRPTSTVQVAAIAGLAFYVIYSLCATLIFRGQTIGKKLLKIKVRRSNTEPVTQGAIFSREFIGKVIINSIPLVPLISLLTIIFTKEHKALHDMFSDTIVSDI